MNIIQHAATLLKNGKLVAIPTETVYGLGADATNPTAIQQVYRVKGRPATNPLIIHIPNSDAMQAWAIDIPSSAWQLAQAFWPGPLTLILKRHPRVPLVVTGGQETVALRVPDHPMALAVLKQFDGGIAAPSANRYGQLSPTTAAHVQQRLGTAVDLILDGGACKIGIESTIVNLTGTTPTILRPGNITKENLERTLGYPLMDNLDSTIQVPGNSASHYAPTQPLYLLNFPRLITALEKLVSQKMCSGVLSFEPKPNFLIGGDIEWITATRDPVGYAQQLYDYLHVLDKTQRACILVETPPNTPKWQAVIDRLQRAHSPTSPLF